MSVNDIRGTCLDLRKTTLPTTFAEPNKDFQMKALAYVVDPELAKVHQLNYGNRLIKSEDLPVPRFEIRWVRCENGSKDFGISYNFVLPYDIRTKNPSANKGGSDEMYLHVSNEDIEVPLNGNGFSVDYVIRVNEVGEMYLYAPKQFMDEALHDSKLCNIPAYVVYKDYAMPISEDLHKPVVSTPTNPDFGLPDTFILDNADDVFSFMTDMRTLGLNDEFSTLAMKNLIEINLRRMDEVGNCRLHAFTSMLSKSFSKVFHDNYIEDVIETCLSFYDSLSNYFEQNQFNKLPTNVLAGYEFGGLHKQSVKLVKKLGN